MVKVGSREQGILPFVGICRINLTSVAAAVCERHLYSFADAEQKWP